MKSACVYFRKPYEVVLEEVEVPDPKEGEVLVQSVATLISTGTELTALTGDFPPNSAWSNYIRFPVPVGYSNAGTVVKAGPGVTTFQEGDRVVSGISHATYGIASARTVQKIPDNLSWEEATFWQLGKVVTNGVRVATVQLGEAVVMLGVGLLGQLAVQLVRLSGGWPVIAVDFGEKRLQTAAEHGATHTLSVSGEEALSAISEITKGRKADVVFEVTGSPSAIPPALKWLRRGGRFIFLGSTRGKVEIDFHNEVHTLGLRLIGAHNMTHPSYETPYNPWTQERNGELFLDLVSAGLLNVKSLITHRYSWQDAPKAYEMLVHDRTEAMGVVFDWREG